MFTYGELAKNFRKVSTDLQIHIAVHDLGEKIVDMTEADDCREPDLPLCETPACHGGEFAILYDEERKADETLRGHDFYYQGAKIVAEKLGFGGRRLYTRWAEANPDLWGSSYGGEMFSCMFAFKPDNTCKEDFTLELSLQDICDWYLAVAERIEKLRDPTEEVPGADIP